MIDETRLREIEQRAEKATAEVVRDGDPPVCRKCEDEYLLTGEDEPTPYCDPCAHAAIAEISTDIPDLLAALREAQAENGRLRNELGLHAVGDRENERDPLVVQVEVNADLVRKNRELREALTGLVMEPAQIAVPMFEGPNVVEKEIDEWVCQHCGAHGDAANKIGHEPGCGYELARAALSRDAGREGT